MNTTAPFCFWSKKKNPWEILWSKKKNQVEEVYNILSFVKKRKKKRLFSIHIKKCYTFAHFVYAKNISGRQRLHK